MGKTQEAKIAPVSETAVVSVNPAGKGFASIRGEGRKQGSYRKSGFFCGCGSLAGILLIGSLLLLPVLLASLGSILVVGLLVGLLVPLLVYVFVYLRSFLPSNDFYTKILILSYKLLLFGRKRPTAKDDMLVKDIRPKRKLKLTPIKYALNIQVPLGAEEEFAPDDGQSSSVTFTGGLAVAFEENLFRLPTTTRWDRFKPGEDCVQYAMDAVGDAYPPVRTLYKEKTTDEALTQICFYGIGAHRLYRERMPSAMGEKASGDWVVRTNMLADLPVREGLDSYGGDCYFDYESWRVTKIVRRMPAEPWQPPEEKEITYLPGCPEWEYVKFVFRSTLLSLVTLVDHLYGIHMQVGNFVTIAQRQQLGPNHPLRRFLVPFCYQTISVNDNARNNLINPKSMGPRNFAFTDEGTQLAWAAAGDLIPSGRELRGMLGDDTNAYLTHLFDYKVYVTYLKEQGIDIPYRQQSLKFWNVMKEFVEKFLKYYYPTESDLAADIEVWRFVLSTLRDMSFTSASSLAEGVGTGGLIDSPHELWFFTCNLITRYCYLVTAGHEHVGTVPCYAQDVSFCAFNWPKGELCGTKQTAITSATLMAFTSTPMPMLMAEPGSPDDWTHLFQGPLEMNLRDKGRVTFGQPGVVPEEVMDAWKGFQKGLNALAEECDDFNAKATAPDAQFPHNFGMWQTNPRYLETAVSV